MRFSYAYGTAVAIAAVVLISTSCTLGPGVRLVNMIPNNRSSETNQDSEPTLAIDPNSVRRMAGSAFTWDNLTGSPMSTATAPIYVSVDRGSSWSLATILPSQIGAQFPTGDITLSFSSTFGSDAKTSVLYGGILASVASPRPMTVLRAEDPLTSTLMTTLDTHTGNVDQPHTQALTAGGSDKLYVGFNNGFGCLAPQGRSATVDASQQAASATPTFILDPLDARNTPCQDGFAIVPAIHKDGTVYGAYIFNLTAPRLIVVRDDNFASGIKPFTALTDPSDGAAGRFVTGTLTIPSGAMGQNRLGASNVSIAVDPRKSDRVYVAWGDGAGFNSETIHVQRSTNRGIDWSGTDLLTVTNAMNPEIAINTQGRVGVLYQAVAASRWETHFVYTTDKDGTVFNTPGIVLASQDATTPLGTFSPYIGDYASVVVSGNNFFGMFSASNFPDKASFPVGVKYQREVDWAAHKLFADGAHTQEIPASIDPFFYEVNFDPPSICSWDLDPNVCHPLEFDPWWWLKCPACSIEVFLNPGDYFTDVTLIDQAGGQIGVFRPVTQEAVGAGAMKYSQHLVFRATKERYYLLKAHVAQGKAPRGDFNPEYLVRFIGGGHEAR